jgi:hypothetical protein
MTKYLRISSYTVLGTSSSYMTLQLLPSYTSTVYEENFLFSFNSVVPALSPESSSVGPILLEKILIFFYPQPAYSNA